MNDMISGLINILMISFMDDLVDGLNEWFDE